MTYQPAKQSEQRALEQHQQNGINFTKTSLQARAEGQIKPKAYNAWDLLALNDLIKGKIEDQNRKTREHNQRLEMRRFYDNQVEEKRRQKQNEMENEVQLGEYIKERVRTIDKLTDVDNTKRMLARGNLALENQTKANVKKAK